MKSGRWNFKHNSFTAKIPKQRRRTGTQVRQSSVTSSNCRISNALGLLSLCMLIPFGHNRLLPANDKDAVQDARWSEIQQQWMVQFENDSEETASAPHPRISTDCTLQTVWLQSRVIGFDLDTEDPVDEAHDHFWDWYQLCLWISGWIHDTS